MGVEQDEQTVIYKVVLNDEEQYSIWPSDRDNALGWRDAGRMGTKAECLDYIKEIWTDMRPLSLRRKMAAAWKTPNRAQNQDRQGLNYKPIERPRQLSTDDLVTRLCEGDHPVEAYSRYKKNVQQFKEAIDRCHVLIRITDTRGGTELGIQLDQQACDFTCADFENGNGIVQLVGHLTLNYAKLRCIACIDLQSLKGEGHLEPLGGCPRIPTNS